MSEGRSNASNESKGSTVNADAIYLLRHFPAPHCVCDWWRWALRRKQARPLPCQRRRAFTRVSAPVCAQYLFLKRTPVSTGIFETSNFAWGVLAQSLAQTRAETRAQNFVNWIATQMSDMGFTTTTSIFMAGGKRREEASDFSRQRPSLARSIWRACLPISNIIVAIL